MGLRGIWELVMCRVVGLGAVIGRLTVVGRVLSGGTRLDCVRRWVLTDLGIGCR